MREATVTAVKFSPLPWQSAGLTYTASGYGSKIPSTRMVQVDHLPRWRRVYVTCYSNAGSAWVVVNGERLSVPDTVVVPAMLGRARVDGAK